MRGGIFIIFTDTMSNMRDNTETKNFKSADLEIYPNLGQVKIDKKTIRLGPVNMRVLVFLLENHQQVVSRSELFDAVWKNQVVSDDALTRCVSDIRTQLSKHSKQTKLIVTIPKRGYQWQPNVTEQNKIHKIVKDKNDLPSNKINLIYSILAILIGLPVLTMLVLWVANLMMHPNQVKVALIPIQISQSSQQTVAIEIEDLLKTKILKTENLRFLSSKAISNHSNNPYPYLFRELGTQLIVEGQIRKHKDKLRISLSLVDARTAIVFHTVSTDFKQGSSQFDNFCQLFINDMLRLLD